MTPELQYLTYVTAFTAIMWIPYVINLIAVRGLVDAVGYPQDPKPLSPWAQRMKSAHANAIENLGVFAVLVLVANAAGITTAGIILACKIYFWARVGHYLVYAAAVPLLRTTAFFVGVACQLFIAMQLLQYSY